MIDQNGLTENPQPGAQTDLLAILNALPRSTRLDKASQEALEQIVLGLPETGVFLKRIVKLAKLGCWIWDEAEDRCIYCSDQLARMNALSVEDYYAERGSLSASLEKIHPDDRAGYYRSVQRATDSKQPYCVEFKKLTADGALRHFRERGQPVLDSEGGLAYTIGLFEDITEAKCLEEELRDREAWYRELFEDSPVSFWVEDWSSLKGMLEGLVRDGVEDLREHFKKHADRLCEAYDAPVIIDISKETLRVYRAESKPALIAMSGSAHADPDDLAGFLEQVVSLYQGAERFEYEAKETACDGAVIFTRMRTVIPPLHRDSWSRVLISVEDLTERKFNEQRFVESQRLQAAGQITAGVAHDFNNLLAIIMGNAEIVSETLGEAGAISRRLDTVIQASKKGGDLTQKLLAFSRQQPLDPRVVDLGLLLDGLRDRLGRVLGAAISIETDIQAGLWPVLADPGQLENALLNLAINAGDAMPAGGRLTITGANTHLEQDAGESNRDAAPGDHVLLAVADSGRGMAPGALERAFEPFFTTKRIGEGSGLGLSMVYGFARQTGGRVAIESEEGRGTTVRLYLPRSAAADGHATDQESGEIPQGRGEAVLVIEDDDQVRAVTAAMLEQLNYRVTSVADVEGARRILRTQEPNLVLSDVVLPGGESGSDFARGLKAVYPALKVVFMSGYPSAGAGEEPAGGLLRLRKPFKRRQIAEALRQMLD